MPQWLAFIESAQAQAGGAGQGPGILATLIPLVLIFGIFYVLIIRPQTKRMKQHKEMINNLEKGDEVISGGGLYARVTRVHEDSVNLELAEGVRVRAQRSSLQTVLPKGTINKD